MANRKSTGKTGRRPSAKKADMEVRLGSLGVPFVADDSGVHGTPSDPNQRRSTSGAYAASSVIERGTARKVAVDIDQGEGLHFCACGCGQQPSQQTSIFMPGHDSKVRSMGKAVAEGRIKLADLPPIARTYLEQGGMLHHK